MVSGRLLACLLACLFVVLALLFDKDKHFKEKWW